MGQGDLGVGWHRHGMTPGQGGTRMVGTGQYGDKTPEGKCHRDSFTQGLSGTGSVCARNKMAGGCGMAVGWLGWRLA